jgi:hypothetical protein
MPVQDFFVSRNLVVLDAVTFAVDFSNAQAVSIQSHTSGPCFVCGLARAVLTMQQANELIDAGVSDLR